MTESRSPSGATHSRQLRHIELGDEPSAWRSAGFVVDEHGHLPLGATTITLTGAGGGFLSWWIEGVESDLDGLSTRRPGADLLEPTGRAVPTEHPNGVCRIDHVVITTGDGERTGAALRSAGLDLRRVRPVTGQGAPRRQLFWWAGDVILEVVAPEEGAGDPEVPTQVFGLALVAEDLEATAARLGELMGRPRDAVQPGRRIAGLRGDRLGVSLPVAVMSPHQR